MGDSLHPRQQAILGFVESYVAENGYASSLREICQALDIPSTSTVTYHLDALQANHLILMDAGVSRSIRLVKALQDGGMERLENGVCFPQASSKGTRRIGRNKVVRKARCQLLSYAGDVLFIALVPEDTENLRTFFEETLKSYQLDSFQEWDTGGWGYFTWRQVKGFCRAHSLLGTLKVFRFN